MVTSITQDRIYKFFGTSNETKPLVYESGKIGNGSIFIEIDTSAIYVFDAENHQWYESSNGLYELSL